MRSSGRTALCLDRLECDDEAEKGNQGIRNMISLRIHTTMSVAINVKLVQYVRLRVVERHKKNKSLCKHVLLMTFRDGYTDGD